MPKRPFEKPEALSHLGDERLAIQSHHGVKSDEVEIMREVGYKIGTAFEEWCLGGEPQGPILLDVAEARAVRDALSVWLDWLEAN